jgi:hypothetical protein
VIAPEVLSAPQVRCVISGSTVYEGRVLDNKACYYIPEGLTTSPIESPEGAELLVITVPMYAQETWRRAVKDIDVGRRRPAEAKQLEAVPA